MDTPSNAFKIGHYFPKRLVIADDVPLSPKKVIHFGVSNKENIDEAIAQLVIILNRAIGNGQIVAIKESGLILKHDTESKLMVFALMP